jgi:hypothetical protein
MVGHDATELLIGDADEDGNERAKITGMLVTGQSAKKNRSSQQGLDAKKKASLLKAELFLLDIPFYRTCPIDRRKSVRFL